MSPEVLVDSMLATGQQYAQTGSSMLGCINTSKAIKQIEGRDYLPLLSTLDHNQTLSSFGPRNTQRIPINWTVVSRGY